MTQSRNDGHVETDTDRNSLDHFANNNFKFIVLLRPTLKWNVLAE